MINIDIKWSNYELSQPEWLWLIPAFIITTILLKKIRYKYLIFSKSAGLADISSNKQTFFHPLIFLFKSNSNLNNTKPLHFIFYTIIFSLIVIALSQPVKTGKKLPEPSQERDITFIVDTSVSMILRDYILNGERIDRMSLLKAVLDKFIHKFKGERMSIIVFGDNAYTLVPITSDQFLLRNMLSRVQATMAGRFNAIGDAIALAVKQASNNKTTKRNKVLVLLTDADQPTGDIDPEIAAQLAKNEKLPLYTIAIGATSLSAEEKQQGGLLYSPVDLGLVQRLSATTGAKSFQAGNPNALEEAIQAISLHEANKRKIEPVYFKESLHYWFLITALILFSLFQLIGLTKTWTKSSINNFRDTK